MKMEIILNKIEEEFLKSAKLIENLKSNEGK